MALLTILFLSFLALKVGIELWLDLRNGKYIQAHASEVPGPFAEKVPLEEHQKAAAYSKGKQPLGLISHIYSAILAVAFTLGGGISWIDGLIAPLGLPALASGTVTIFAVMMAASLLELPFSIYSTFVIEERFGFNKTTPKTFIVDMIKGLFLGMLLGLPLLYLLLWLIESIGSLWWLAAFGVLTAFNLTLLWVYPRFIAPLFNKFEPLEDGEVKDTVEALLQRIGFASKGVFIMDGSKRSSHGNAYFTGLGRNKRIVFFDTLLKTLTPKEIEAVLAHELGHYKRKHVLKRMILSFASTLVSLALLGWLMEQAWFYSSMGVTTASSHTAFLLFMYVTPPFTFIFTPIFAWMSRRDEFEADAFASEYSQASDLINGLVKLYTDNASTLTPEPLYSTFYHSHPPPMIRVANLEGQE